MHEGGSISVWIGQLKSADAHAAQCLWERYYHRLVGLARKKLYSTPCRSADEDDIVQSAFKSFFLRAQAGKFPDLRDRENLWPLLVLITARKAANQRKHTQRAKRGGGRIVEAPTTSEFAEFAAVIARDPSPADATVFTAEFSHLMEMLDDPSQRVILLWKLEDRTNLEIAGHLDCSLSAVERKMRLIRDALSSRLVE